VAVTIFWGLSFTVFKALALLHEAAVPESGGWFITAWSVAPRFLLAAAILAVWRWRTLAGLTGRELKQGLGLAGFAGLGLLFQVDGLQHTSASVSAFLTQVYAVLIPLWVAAHTRRWPRAATWCAGALVLVGVAILARFDPRDMRLGRGETQTLIGALFFMGQILWIGRSEFVGNRASRVTLVMFGALGLAFLALALVTAPSPGALLEVARAPAWVGLTLLLTVVCTLLTFTAMNAWQPRITPTEAGLIYCIEPVSAAAMALVLPAVFSVWAGIDYANETLTWHLFAGGALVTLANVIVVLRPPAPPPTALAPLVGPPSPSTPT
jgi:drug/metabolite transporter (DMT)-like permease